MDGTSLAISDGSGHVASLEVYHDLVSTLLGKYRKLIAKVKR